MELKEKRIYFAIFFASIVSYFSLGEKSLSILILLNIILASLYLRNKVKENIFSIETLFIINYLMYVLYTPIRLLDPNYNGEMFYELSGDRLLASKIVLICGIIALISFIVGKYLFYKYLDERNHINKSNKIEQIEKRIFEFVRRNKKYINVNYFLYFLIFVGLSLFSLGIIKQGGISYIFSKYIWNSDKMAEIGYMTTGIQIAYSGIIIAFYKFIKEEELSINKLLKWPISYIFLFITIIKFIQGGRIQVLMALITLISIYSMEYKKISLKNAIIVAGVGIVILGYIGYFRDYKTLIPDDFGIMMKYILGGSASLEYFLNSYTIFTTMHVISSANISYLWGGTLLDGIIFMVPRFILPNKDELVLTNQKLAELNNIEVISPVGGLNLAAQNLLNGNVIFTILFMILISILILYLTKYKDKSKYGKLLYCMVMPYIVISAVRNPIFYSIKEVVTFAIVPYFIYMILDKGEQYEEKQYEENSI